MWLIVRKAIRSSPHWSILANFYSTEFMRLIRSTQPHMTTMRGWQLWNDNIATSNARPWIIDPLYTQIAPSWNDVDRHLFLTRYVRQGAAVLTTMHHFLHMILLHRCRRHHHTNHPNTNNNNHVPTNRYMPFYPWKSWITSFHTCPASKRRCIESSWILQPRLIHTRTSWCYWARTRTTTHHHLPYSSQN